MKRLRQNTRRFKRRAVESLMLAIELFNRPSPGGRTEAVFLHLQHAFEMLLKGAIWESRGTVFDKKSRISHTFDKCLAIARSDLGILSDDEFRTLAEINGLRDCAQHYLLVLTEDALYLHAQASVTLFGDLLTKAFGENLGEHLPSRVLPVSTRPPSDIDLFLTNEFEHIKTLLQPGKRQRAEVFARLRPYLIMESSVGGQVQQPTDAEVANVTRRLKQGEDWHLIFPGVARLELTTEGRGLSYRVRIATRSDSAPVRIIREWENVPDAALIREVDMLDRYSMGLHKLAEHLGLTPPKTLALIEQLAIQKDPKYFRPVRIDSSTYKRYSPDALEALRRALKTVNIDEVWRNHRDKFTRTKKTARIG